MSGLSDVLGGVYRGRDEPSSRVADGNDPHPPGEPTPAVISGPSDDPQPDEVGAGEPAWDLAPPSAPEEPSWADLDDGPAGDETSTLDLDDDTAETSTLDLDDDTAETSTFDLDDDTAEMWSATGGSGAGLGELDDLADEAGGEHDGDDEVGPWIRSDDDIVPAGRRPRRFWRR